MFHLLSSYATYFSAPVEVTGGRRPLPASCARDPELRGQTRDHAPIQRHSRRHRRSATLHRIEFLVHVQRPDSTTRPTTPWPGDRQALARGPRAARPRWRRLSTASVLTARSTSLDVPTQTPTSAAPRASLRRGCGRRTLKRTAPRQVRIPAALATTRTRCQGALGAEPTGLDGTEASFRGVRACRRVFK
jgi:hypothetical protein